MFEITVPSTSNPRKSHTVRFNDGTWTCTCKDHVFRSRGRAYTCKHIADLAVSLTTFVTNSSRSASALAAVRGAGS